MRLRTQLLLLALVALVLPWAGWQFVRGFEARLRDGQAAALVDSAGVLAGALAAARPSLPPAMPVLFVHEAPRPLQLDGDGGDWVGLRGYAQAFGAGGELRVSFARYGGALHVLADVVDATPLRPRASAVGTSGAGMIGDGTIANDTDGTGAGDALRLLLDHGAAVRALRVEHAVAGRALVVDDGDAAYASRVVAAWRDTPTGYTVELRLPPGPLPQRLGIEAVDRGVAVGADGEATAAGQTGERRHGTAPDRLGGLWPLAQHSDALSQRLAAIVPPGLRARVLHPDGWVLARAGALVPFSGAPLPAVQRWLYAAVAESPPPAHADWNDPRVPQPIMRGIVSGDTRTSWSRPDGGVQLRLGAYAPLSLDGDTRALLHVERRSDAALLAQQALSGLLGASLLAMLVVAAALFAYASWLGWRVRRLGRAVDQAMVRERGAPASFAASNARDELGELSRRFQRLLEEVAGYTDYLRTLASKLSHELHTPLAVVRSSLENLEAQALPDTAAPYIERARAGSERLGAIIRAMSEATRVERAIASADAEHFDLRELVAGCAESYRPLLAPRRLELILPPAPVPFRGAPELLAQALDKLIDNARGFCPPDGWVAIALGVHEQGVELAVANAGPPLPGPSLPEAAHARLFESLVSLRERGTREDGTPHLGLGLHIVRLIAEQHRGEAIARNLPTGGVEFRLRLRGMPQE